MDKREHARPEQSINNRFSKWNSDTKDSIQVSHDVPKDNMNVKDKSLIGIPFRFVIEMINRGWICRQTIIWKKNNVMPSSVKDRFTVDFEYIFFFSKQGKYYFEQQFEKSSQTFGNYEDDIRRRTSKKNKQSKNSQQSKVQWNSKKIDTDRIKLGRNKRTVWEINTKPYKEAHFAVFPEALIETPILAGCPEFVCKKCGKAREKIIESKSLDRTQLPKEHEHYRPNRYDESYKNKPYSIHQPRLSEKKTIGYTDCGCDAGFDSGIVLDMFMGSGTTGLVALKNNRKYVGIEMNKEYIDMAEKRLSPYQNHKLGDFQ